MAPRQRDAPLACQRVEAGAIVRHAGRPAANSLVESYGRMVHARESMRLVLDNRRASATIWRSGAWVESMRPFVNALRVVALCLALWLLSQPALAQSATDQPAPPEAFSHARVIAISLGALAGMIVANTLTDGLVLPVLTATRAGAAPALAALQGTAVAGYAGITGQEAAEALAHAAQARIYLVEASRLALVMAGAVGGGYLGYWLDGGH